MNANNIRPIQYERLNRQLADTCIKSHLSGICDCQTPGLSPLALWPGKERAVVTVSMFPSRIPSTVQKTNVLSTEQNVGARRMGLNPGYGTVLLITDSFY